MFAPRFGKLAALALFSLPCFVKAATPFCSDCQATRQFFRRLCDYVVAERSDFDAGTKSARTIFTNGYYMRTLVAGYEIFGDRRYLDTAIRYGDILLAKQSPRGY